MAQAAVIFGMSGTELTDDERALFNAANPWGYILFQRNCVSRAQVRTLTEALRSLSGRSDLPILIDEEGGRVQRLKPPEWRVRPAMRRFGEIYERDRARGIEAARLDAALIAADLAELGINVDCIPCLDRPVPGAHAIIGDRAFGSDPEMIAALGRAVAEGLIGAGVLPVIKHMPGHGRANLDTHEALPRVATPHQELSRTDFAPFRAMKEQALGMSAHVIFEAIDSQACATLSAKLIAEIIRGEIGFDGLLMTDDLNMNALQGTLPGRAASALKAGCDVALHCNGKLDEMTAIAEVVPQLSGKSLERANAATALLARARKIARPSDIEPRLKELLS